MNRNSFDLQFYSVLLLDLTAKEIFIGYEMQVAITGLISVGFVLFVLV